MPNAFKKILVPVDFSRNTEVAVAKALTLCVSDAIIHLVHVVKPAPFSRSKIVGENCVEKLNAWKQCIEETAEQVTVHCSISQSFFLQDALQKSAAEIQPGIVIIGQSSMKESVWQFNAVKPMRLVEVTGVPVLTVKPGALRSKIKTVVVLITNTSLQNKMQALEALCQHGRLSIHLVTFVNDSKLPSEFSASALLQMYQWLKDNLHCPVEYATLHGSQKTKLILAYAEKIGADILLMHPEKGKRLQWRRGQVPELLPRNSKVQVLAVN